MEILFCCFCFCCLVTKYCMTICKPVVYSTPEFPFTISQSMLKFMSIESMMPSNHPCSVDLWFSCPQSFPAPRSYPNESAILTQWPKYCRFSFSITSSKEYSGWFPLGLTGLISLKSKGLSRIFPTTTVRKHQLLGTQPSLWLNSHDHIWLQKNHSFDYMDFISKVFSYALLFNMLFRFFIAFCPRRKHHLISWLQSPTSDLESRKIKYVTVSTFSPSICHEAMGPDAMILVFGMLSFKPTFPLSSFTFFKRLFSSSSLSAFRVILSEVVDIFLINIDSSMWFI